jgi:hypothetical protein
VHSDNAFRGGEDAILELAEGRLLSCSMLTSLSTAAEEQETGELMIIVSVKHQEIREILI